MRLKLWCEKCNGSGYDYRTSPRQMFGRLCYACCGTGLRPRWLVWLKLQFWTKRRWGGLLYADFQYIAWNPFVNPPWPWTCRECNGQGVDPYCYPCESCDATGLRWQWVQPIRAWVSAIRFWFSVHWKKWRRNRNAATDDIPF